jgi:tRNA(Ile)-lysidine synthase
MNKQDIYNGIKQIVPQQSKILLACSGGVDSMVLLHALVELNYKVIVAHVNYQLRENDSELDQQLVEKIAKQYQLDCFCKVVDMPVELQKGNNNLQDVARTIRYQFFEELIKAHQIDFLFTAHHANDQIETVLLNISRGCALNGLGGIKFKNNNIIRPLLKFSKQQILGYANQNKIEWRQDKSNFKSLYKRNQLRNELIPLWHDLQPNFSTIMLENIERWQAAEEVLNEVIDKSLKKEIKIDGVDQFLSIKFLQKQKNAWLWLRQFLPQQEFSAGQITEAEKLLLAHNGSVINAKTVQLVKLEKHLVLTPIIHQQKQTIVVNENDTKISFESHKLDIKKSSEINAESASEVFLNADKIVWPLLLRPWKEGDYFYPLGLNKKKKIARFLIDNKVPNFKKNQVWVLESQGKIIWVVGQRIDHRFAYNVNTKNYLHLSLQTTK